MEKQTTFSMKPPKFLFFSLTISSSLIFFTFFFLWIIKATPSFQTPLSSALKPFTAQTLTGFSKDLKDSVLTDANLRTTQNVSAISDGVSRMETQSKVPAPQEAAKLGRFSNTFKADNATSVSANLSALAVNYSTPITEHSRKTHDINSGVAVDSFPERLQEKDSARAFNGNNRSGYSTSRQPQEVSDKLNVASMNGIEEKRKTRCDITKGKWVFDESYPLYRNTSCPFIDEGFNCEANGRLDKDYMKWRWQPQDCDIQRFNATNMLELIRGKRLVFVGDSLNRNQWESMLCLLMGAVKDPSKVYEARRRRITKEKGEYMFKFVDYKCTVEYYVTHFLVHESKARVGKKRVQTLRIDTIDKGSSKWRGADILVFNTAHWWSHHKTKAGINYYQEGDQVHPRLDVSVAFKRALLTWASWVDKHINPRKTQVFFRSSAPAHFSGGQWDTGGHCKEASQPTNVTLGDSFEKNVMAEEVLRQMKTPVTFLNISGLSNYRIDGHPSVYGRKSGRSNSLGVQDCSHWCLPGVPDSWNELLYFHLKAEGRSSRIQ